MMAEKIAHLRALLIDDGWDVERKADALKTLAEIEAAWDALLAPVDEAEVGNLLGAMRGVPPSCAADVADVIRPLVTDRARLAREVERLTGCSERSETALRHAHADVAQLVAKLASRITELAAARADLEACGGELQTCRTTLAEERADVDRLGQELAAARAEIALLTAQLKATVDRAHADTDALTAELAALRTAAPGEAWERLSTLRAAGWTVAVHNDYRLNGEPHTFWLFTREGRAIKGEGRTDAEALTTCCALAAVEPRADTIAVDPSAPVDSRDALAAAETEIRRIYRAHPLDTWIPVLARRMAAPVIDVTAITHDYRPGAQDGMPRCPDLYVDPGGCEACGNATGERHAWRCEGAAEPLTPAETREIIASAPGQIGPRGEVTDAELADVLACTSDHGPLAWPGSILRRLALAEQARRAAPAMTTERAREVAAIRARHADESGAFCGVAYSWRQAHEDRAALLSILSADVTREALAATPTPPRALTEAEARSLAEHIGIKLGLAKDGDEEPVVTASRAILGWHAARGNVPPEVRPAVDPSFVQATGTRTFGGRLRSDVRPMPAPEMAVTTGEDAPARQCVAVLATNDAGEVLLVRTKRGLELPGGGVEPGEQPLDAALREVREEAGLIIEEVKHHVAIIGTAKPGASYRSRITLYRATAEGEPKAGSDALMAMWVRPTLVLQCHEEGGLSDLDTRPALLAWAREVSACNVDHTPDERPRVLGGECAECLHRPPLHEPTCTKARCSHTPAASPPDRRAALAAAEHAYLVGAGWIHHPEGRIPPGPEDGWTWEEGVWEDVTDPDRNTIAGGPARWDHEHALREQLARDGHPRGRRGAAARTWSEEQIREAWYRAQETGRPGHERPREADDLANGWEHVRAALHGKAV